MIDFKTLYCKVQNTLENRKSMKLKKNIAISESGFLFDPSSGDSFNLNKTGQQIVKMLSEGKSENAIIRSILEEFKVEKHTLQRYLDDFYSMLRQFNLIENE